MERLTFEGLSKLLEDVDRRNDAAIDAQRLSNRGR